MIDKSNQLNEDNSIYESLKDLLEPPETYSSKEKKTTEIERKDNSSPVQLEVQPLQPQEVGFKNFPSEFNESRSTDSRDAQKQLEKICHELARHGDYSAVRDRFCQLSLEMNHYALHAPGFRPRPRVKKSFGKSVCMQIHRDLGVIDCHWLFVRHEHIRVDRSDALYQPLFDSEMPFDFDLAWSFVNENWRSETKVSKALHLTEVQQYQSASLRSKSVADRFNRLTVGKRENGKLLLGPLHQATTALNKWCEDDSRVLPEFDTYEGIFTAHWLLGTGCKLSALALLTGLVLGQPPMNPRTLGGKLEKLLQRLETHGAASGPQQ